MHPNPPNPFTSVIIPVRQSDGGLARTLCALATQTYPNDRFEVVIVENGSTAPVLPTLFPKASDLSLSWFHEPIAGSYRARNRGMREARGELFAFTDADCVPDPDWLAMGVSRLQENPHCGLVAGRVLPIYCEGQNKSHHYYQLLDFFPQDFYVQECRFGATASMFTRRSVWKHVGDFSHELFSGGDMEWGERVSALYSIAYTPKAIVSHPLRATFQQVFQRERRCAGGLGVRNRLHPTGAVKDLGHKLLRKLKRFGYRIRAALLLEGVSLGRRTTVVALIFFFQLVWITERIRVWITRNAINA